MVTRMSLPPVTPTLCYTPLAVVSRARNTLRVSTTATDNANSGCFVERGRCDRRCTQHAKIPSGSSLTPDT
jgi:hypothetical protein